MTPRERVIASLEHRQPDVTPYHVTFTAPARRKMIEYYGDPDFESRLQNCLVLVDTAPPQRGVPGRPGVEVDEFGVQWDKSIDTDIGSVCNIRITPETFRQYVFPDPEDPARFAGLPSAIRQRGKNLCLPPWDSRCSSARGPLPGWRTSWLP